MKPFDIYEGEKTRGDVRRYEEEVGWNWRRQKGIRRNPGMKRTEERRWNDIRKEDFLSDGSLKLQSCADVWDERGRRRERFLTFPPVTPANRRLQRLVGVLRSVQRQLGRPSTSDLLVWEIWRMRFKELQEVSVGFLLFLSVRTVHVVRPKLLEINDSSHTGSYFFTSLVSLWCILKGSFLWSIWFRSVIWCSKFGRNLTQMVTFLPRTQKTGENGD